MKPFFGIVLIFWLTGFCAAQDMEATSSRGLQTFMDDVSQDTNNPWGFSLSAYGAYSTDVSSQSDQQNGSFIAAFMPRTFFNLGRHRSRFHMDLGGGYRRYSSQSNLNSWDYFGNAGYTNQLSRHASLEIVNQLTSSFNDSTSFMSLYSPLHRDYLSNSYEVLFNRQRITRNSLDATFSYQLGRKASLRALGAYNLYRYSQQTLTDSDTVQAGGGFDYQLTNWLSFSSNYLHYLNHVDQLHQNAQIQRIQAGGLSFHLSRYWRLWGSGGVEFSDYQGQNRIIESINGGIGYTSRDASLSLTYQRGFTSAIGLSSSLMASDMVSTELGYRITRIASVNLNSYFTKGVGVNYSGNLRTLTGSATLGFAVLPELILSLNGTYQNQKDLNSQNPNLHLNRLSVYAGLQYVWPSRRRTN
jgi:hypothetical protein